MPGQQEAYRQFAAQSPDLPLFLQPWYLDAVCVGGIWDAALVHKNNRVVAALPYFLKQKLAWKYVSMPPFCKQMGPFLAPEFRSTDWEMKLYEALIQELPAGLVAFEQNFHYGVQNWLPFYWQGFRQTTLYSYMIPLDQTEEALFGQISKNYRQKLRAAEKTIQVRHDLPLSELNRLVALSFERQKLKTPLSLPMLEALYRTLQEHQCVQLFYATDAAGAVHSASMLVWDRQTAYYLMSGDDPALRQSGAAVLLKWKAILYAKNVLQLPLFDFEGSMIRGVEQGRRDFGAQQKPYFRVGKDWSVWWKWGKVLRFTT
ncbi:MAG: GNAT family N-acetyltransferase [Saprospiraceae bacterium]|nr:GNAT family N-acetyltransferase [Saprospiraceae bacterium]